MHVHAHCRLHIVALLDATHYLTNGARAPPPCVCASRVAFCFTSLFCFLECFELIESGPAAYFSNLWNVMGTVAK